MDSPVLSSAKRKPAPTPSSAAGASRLVQLQQEARARARNSTSTLFIRDTVTRPNMTTLVRCIATALVTCIERGHEHPEPTFVEIFDERVHPFSEDEGIDFSVPPDLNTVFLFLAVMFNTEQLSAESGILMLAYIDRIIETSGLTLHASNWRRIVLSTLLLATKVWEDEEVWNADWQSVFPSMTSLDLGRLERKLLTLLQYNVSLKSSVYAKYYFELRSLAESEDQIFPTEPLDRESALKLEARSQAKEEKILESLKPTARAKSMMIGKAKAPAPMILN